MSGIEQKKRDGDQQDDWSGGLAPEHDVLTLARGWVPIAAITLDDAVACLDHVTHALSYQKPTQIRSRSICGEEMYMTRSPTISLHVALSHHMYVKRQWRRVFEPIEAQQAACREMEYKRDAVNVSPDVESFVCSDVAIPMDAWILIYAAYVKNGKLVEIARDKSDPPLRLKKKHWRRIMSEHAPKPIASSFFRVTFCDFDALVPALIGLDRAGVRYWQKHLDVLIESCPISIGLASDHCAQSGELVRFHPFAWTLSRAQAMSLFKALLKDAGDVRPRPEIGGAFQQLALHAGLSAALLPKFPASKVRIFPPCDGAVVDKELASVMYAHPDLVGHEAIRPHTTVVHDITVPTGIYYVRHYGIPSWICGGL